MVLGKRNQEGESLLKRDFPLKVDVLIQDPNKLPRQILEMTVDSLPGARVVAQVTTVDEALAAARLIEPDMVILDLAEPDRALPVIRALSQSGNGPRIICLADELPPELIEEALNAGGTGFALKSDSADEILNAFQQVQAGNPGISPIAATPIVQNYLDLVRESWDHQTEIIETLASAVEAKDANTAGHSRRVTALATRIATQFDAEFALNSSLQHGFMLHDVGKIGIPESILFKAGKLNSKEWQVMQTHPALGSQIVIPVDLGKDVEDVVLSHHERWDGEGYPNKLKGEDIPLSARIFALADTYDAMTNDRPYREGMPRKQAITEIAELAGSQFDPSAVESFLAVV